MEGRLTVCNMAIEAGARSGMIAPDDNTYAYLAGREFTLRGPTPDKALLSAIVAHRCRRLRFDREVTLDAATLAPMITWGYESRGGASSITAAIPDPATASDAEAPAHGAGALRYMDLAPAHAGRWPTSSAHSSAPAPTAALRICARRQWCQREKSVVPAWVSAWLLHDQNNT